MMPVGFWPLDGTHGDSDISEQVIGWNVTSVDTTLTTGVMGYPDTAYAFNGITTMCNTREMLVSYYLPCISQLKSLSLAYLQLKFSGYHQQKAFDIIISCCIISCRIIS